ncbi:MAG TPA: threonine synthase, partial [Clostridia bacterium]|nr:threonine synthase [Clostridia bacterium]
MTIEIAPAPRTESAATAGRPVMAAPRVAGLVCRNCRRPEPLGPSYVCAACFGPLEVAYDRDAVRAAASRAAIEARPPGLWRYLEFLPVDAPPARGLAVGSTPLLRADRLGPTLG